MTRVSPPELEREFPGPHESTRVTCAPGRRRCRAVQPPKAPAPTTAAGRIATYELTGKLTTAGLITGVVGLGFGIPVVVLSPRTAYVYPDGSPAPPPRDAPRVMIAPWITWGGAGMRGIF